MPHPYALADAEWFVNKSLTEQSAQKIDNYELAITLKPSNEVIGVV